MNANDNNLTWARRLSGLVSAAVVVVGIAACGGGGGGGGGVVNPEDSNAMSRALAVKFGGTDAERRDGNPPSTPGNPDNPTVSNVPGEEQVTPGQTKEISFNAETSPSSALAVLYAKVSGSNDYFAAVLGQTQSLSKQSNGSLSLSFEIPQNLSAGQFCVEISAGDSDDRVSEVEQVCFNVQPEEFSPAAVQSRLQGTWELCNGRFLERGTFEGNILNFRETEYAGTGCSGEVVRVINDTIEYSIGPAFQANDGLLANTFDAELIESDIPEEVGVQFAGIVRVTSQPDELFLNPGEENGTDAQRPTGFVDPPFLRPQTGDVPRSQQVWEQSVSGTVDGQSFSDITSQVSGNDVPFEQPSEEQFTVESVVPPQQGQSCDSGTFDGEINVFDIAYSFNGDGSVGSVVDLSFSFSVNGSCQIDGQSQQISSSGNFAFTFERLQ